MRLCVGCGQPVVRKRSDAIYCSDTCYFKIRNRSPERREYFRQYARKRRAAGKTKIYEGKYRYRLSGESHAAKKAWLRCYYYRNRSAYQQRRREWIKHNRQRHRDTQFERKIRDLPDEIREMRRVLREFKIWCRTNGHKYRVSYTL